MHFELVLVLRMLENACWILCYFPKAEIFLLSPNYWPGMTSFVWTVFGVLLLEIE